MINYDTQLKLQAYLDGELTEADAREIAQLLAHDQEAVALLAELRNTRQCLAGCERGIVIVVPESREFFWSKIERQIERETPIVRAPEKVSLWNTWRRLMVPAGALAGVIIAGLLAGVQFFKPALGPGTDTSLADPGTFTYRDYAAGTTLVWVTYPAENELAESERTATLPQ
jgi:anti-sigma factor RsiW